MGCEPCELSGLVFDESDVHSWRQHVMHFILFFLRFLAPSAVFADNTESLGKCKSMCHLKNLNQNFSCVIVSIRVGVNYP